MIVVFAIVLFWLPPDRNAEARECSARCGSELGFLVPDPRFEKSFKPQAYAGPRVCRCASSVQEDALNSAKSRTPAAAA